MKKTVLILIALSIGLMASAQALTAEYMKKIPALPKDSCNATKAVVEAFSQQVGSLRSEIDDQIGQLNDKGEATMGNSEEVAKANAMKQMSEMYGMSPEDIEKMKNSKNMSAADKQAMASKMMQQQTNMSMEEVQNMGNMSEAGKKAYAEAYATEAMATAGSDPKTQQRNASAANITQLVSSQQAIQGKISASTQKISSLYTPITNDPEGQKMLNNIDAWHSKWISMSGVEAGQGKQMDSLALLIKNEKIRYCDKFTPKYRAALKQHMGILKASLPDYQALADVTADLTKAQTGVTIPAESGDIASLGAVNAYLGKLQGVFQFKLYFPEDDY